MSWPKSLKLIKRLPALCLRLHLTNRSRTACHRWAAASQIGYSKASAALSSSSSRSKWRSPLVRRGPKTKPKRGAHNYVWELQTANGRKGLCNFSIEFSPRALPLEWIRHPLLLFSACLHLPPGRQRGTCSEFQAIARTRNEHKDGNNVADTSSSPVASWRAQALWLISSFCEFFIN